LQKSGLSLSRVEEYGCSEDKKARVKDGYLYKTGGAKKGIKGKWQRRWFVLSKDFFEYSKTPAGKTCGVIEIRHIEDILIDATNKPNSFAIQTSIRTYYMYAANDQDRAGWIDALTANVDLFRETK